jgi:hypothetical protein
VEGLGDGDMEGAVEVEASEGEDEGFVVVGKGIHGVGRRGVQAERNHAKLYSYFSTKIKPIPNPFVIMQFTRAKPDIQKVHNATHIPVV